MIIRGDGTRYLVRLSVPRRGGWRAWGAVSGEFERRLAGQESPVVISPRIESETRRGKDYVRVTISMTARVPDVAQALTAAWWAFQKAVGDDTAGWDMVGVAAQVRPGEALTAEPGVHKPSIYNTDSTPAGNRPRSTAAHASRPASVRSIAAGARPRGQPHARRSRPGRARRVMSQDRRALT